MTKRRIIIPARLHSKRVNEKALVRIHGTPLIVRAAELALDQGFHVLVATDSVTIQDVCRRECIESVLTGPADTGTDRVAMAIRMLDLPDDPIIILQGDIYYVREPILQDVIKQHIAFGADMTTVGYRNNATELLWRPNRQPNTIMEISEFCRVRSVVHVGIYVYTRDALMKFYSSGRTPAEERTDIEGQRAVDLGLRCQLFECQKGDVLDVNVPGDLPPVLGRPQSYGGAVDPEYPAYFGPGIT